MKEIRWISSGEYLPSYGQEVITLGPKGGMVCGFFRHVVDGFPDRWEWPGGGVRKVSWWMPREMLPPMPVDGQLPIWYCEAVAGRLAMREMILEGVKLRRCCGQAPVMRRINFKTSVYYEVECAVTGKHKTGLCDSKKGRHMAVGKSKMEVVLL